VRADLRYDYVTTRFILLAVLTGFAATGPLLADENVREVQEQLRNGGFYSGEIDGAYSTELSAALSRYQIRNGLPITGQLDVETSKALGAKPGVDPSSPETEQGVTKTWRQLRKAERTNERWQQTGDRDMEETRSARSDEPKATDTGTPLQEVSGGGSALPSAAASNANLSMPDISPGRLHNYVAAFILAGLDRNVDAETEFFADRVQYYDQGIMDRQSIRKDLKQYDERWPERHFWVAGTIHVEPQDDKQVQVTFPLGFKLRNGNKILTGKVDKTIVLTPSGRDLQITAVNERKTE
jgi:peptidoglycan hydrolase-like protein with peptidoglycan-binding domain